MAIVRERGIYNFATPFRGYVKLPWHLAKERENYGYLDLRPQYNLRTFSVARWLNPDGGWYKSADDEEPLRYSELDEFDPDSWEARMHPWEDDQKGCAGIGFFGYDERCAKRYVDERLHAALVRWKFDSVGVAYKPFGGEPMICGLKDNKVTIL